jgi:dCMP deaminase
MTRPDWDDWYLSMLPVIGQRSTCDRGRSGCLVARSNYQLVMGYVGAPHGFPHCDEAGHLLVTVDGKQHCMRTVHAEQNAIITAARLGTALNKSTFYTTMEPCRTCAMMIAGVGAKRVVSIARYHGGEEAREIFKLAGIKLDVLSQEELYDPEKP